MTDIDIEAATGGRFQPRITSEGRPIGFVVEDGGVVVVREGGSSQRIDGAAGIGLVAACATDGRVLGYGTLGIHDIPALAADADAALGRSVGRDLERLASHGLLLAAPIDAMPDAMRDMFLAETVPTRLLADVAIDDDVVGDALADTPHHGHHHHHDHEHHHHDGTECAACSSPAGLDGVRNDVERMIARSGHAVITVPPAPGGVGLTYSVGLLPSGMPELLLTGIVGKQGVMILNEVVRVLRASGAVPTDGGTVEKAVNVPLRLRVIDADAARAYMRMASERHGRQEEFRALQVMWPDASGTFPDEEGYDGHGLPPQALVRKPGGAS